MFNPLQSKRRPPVRTAL